MRALRESYAGGGRPEPVEPVEPLVVLAAVGRAGPLFDPEEAFDRVLFGLTADDLPPLGPIVPHLCEVAYEALEQAAVRFDRLPITRVGTWLGWSTTRGSDRDAATVAEILGLPGPAVVVTETGCSALLALHVAAQSVRSGEVDLALVLGEHGDGVSAVLIGRPDRAADEAWRVRALLLGSAAARVGAEPPARELAALRSGLDPQRARMAPEHGLHGVCAVVASLEEVTEPAGIGVDEVGDTLVAHAVFGSAEQTAIGEGPPPLLTLSARTRGALDALVHATAERVGSESDLAGLANDALCRPSFELRVAVPTTSAAEVRERLLAWADGSTWQAASGRVVDADDARVAFVVPPAGAQFANMADELYAEPVFRDALGRCDRALRSALPRPLLSVMYPSKGREVPVDDPVFANPLTFALAYGLAELLRSRGVVPAAVLGCGVGELAAAAIAGAVEVEAGLRLAVERGRLLRTVTQDAWRCVLLTTEDRAAELVAGVRAVDIVAVPVPDRVVVGGEPFAVSAVAARAEKVGITVARISGGAGHSPVVDPILPDFAAAAENVPWTATDVAVVSAATGRRLEAAGPDHWVATVRAPIRLAAAVHTTQALGCRLFVELSPKPTVANAGEAALATVPGSRWFPLLQPGMGNRRSLAEAMAELWVRGVPVHRGEVGRVPGAAELPTYPWDRRALDEDPTEEAARPATPQKAPAWLTELPELAVEPEITLVPWDDSRSANDLSDEGLVDLVNPPRRRGGRALQPLAKGPAPDYELSVDSDPAPAPAHHSAADGADARGLSLSDLRTAPRLREPEPVQDPIGDLLPPDVADPSRVWSETWVDDPLPAEDPPVSGVTFVILADAGGIGDYLSTLLEQAGNQVLRVFAAAPYPRDDGALFVAEPLAPGAWQPLVDGLGALRGTTQILHLWSLDAEGGTGPDAAIAWPAVAGLAQELASRGADARVHLVTRGAVIAPDPSTAAVGGGMWGLAALLGAELPGLFGGVVDLDPDDEDADALLRHLLQAVGAPGGAHALRGGARLRRALELRDAPPQEPVDASGAWVLAGDIDAPALELARSLGAAGVKRVYLVPAAAPPPDVLRGVLDLQREGVGCIVIRADLAEARDRDVVRQRLAKEAQLSGIVVRDAACRAPFRELRLEEGFLRWRRAADGIELLLELAPDAPVWAWCEGRALDGLAGSGFGAPLGAALAARLASRQGGPAGVFHTGPAAAWARGQAVRLLVRLAGAGGATGVWR